MFEAFSIFGKIALQGMGQVNQELSGLQQKLKGMGQGFMKAGKTLTMGLTLPIVGLGTAAFKMSGDFDQAMRATNVMLGASEDEMKNYKKEILALSNKTGKSADEIAASFYTIVSAGHRGADAIDVLATSVEGAVGGAADAQATTEALTKAMNVFGLEGVPGASRAMDTFFGIVDSGLLSFEEMANAFPRASTSAAGLGVTIEETGAALATLSKVSGSTEQASTALNAVFTQLIKPSENMLKLYEEWGVKTGPEAIEKFGGLQGVLLKVTEATGGDVAALSELFPNVEAIRAVLPLTTTNAKDFAEALDTVTNSTGRAGEAFDEMAQGPGYQWNVFMQTAKNALISIGDVIAEYVGPWLEKLGGYVKGAVEWFGKLDPRWQKIILGIVAALALVGPVLMIIGGAMMGLNAIMMASPITWIILGVVATLAILGAAIYMTYRTLKKNWDKIMAVVNKVKEVFGKVWDWIKTNLYAVPLEKIKRAWNSIKEFFAGFLQGVKEGFRLGLDFIKNLFFEYTPLGIIISNWDPIVTWFADMWERVKEAFIVAGQAIWDWMLNWVPGLNIIVENWDLIVATFKAGWDKILGFFIGIGTAVKDFFVNQIKTMWNISIIVWTAIADFFKKIWNGIYNFFKPKIDAIRNYFKAQLEAMKQVAVTVWNAVKDFFVRIWGNIKTAFMIPILYIKNLIITTFNWLKNGFIIPVWNSIKEYFRGLWNDVKENFNKFKEAFLKIWDNIAEGIKSPINKIIGFMNKMIKGVQDAINGLVSGLNRIKISVPSWIGKLVPGLAGKRWSVNLGKVSFGGIPLLQKGAEVTKAGAVIVGDEGPEILSLPKGAEVRPLDKTVTKFQEIHIHNEYNEELASKTFARLFAQYVGEINR